MSLDVYLSMPETSRAVEQKIYIRRDGSNAEITREEWDFLYPGVEPVISVSDGGESREVYWGNITHNLGRMADAAGIYDALWTPEERGFSKASQLIEPLRNGLKRLKDNPDEYRKYNALNGWGTYEGLVEFVTNYLAACEKYPDAKVSVWK